MKQKVVIIFLTVLVFSLLTKCWVGGTEEVTYKISDIQLTNLIIDSTGSADRMYYDYYQFDSTIHYGILLEFDYIDLEREKISQLNNSSIFFNEAKAFSETITRYVLTNPIDSINITTINDFDSIFKSNDCINDYFEYWNLSNYNYLSMTDSLLNDLKKNESINYDYFPSIYFKLLRKPVSDSAMSFCVSVYFRNSTIISKNINPFIE